MPGLGAFGVKSYGLSKRRKRFVYFIQVLVHNTQLVVLVGIFRVLIKQFFVMFYGFLGLTGFAQRFRQVLAHILRIRICSQHLFERPDGSVCLAVRAEDIAQRHLHRQ